MVWNMTFPFRMAYFQGAIGSILVSGRGSCKDWTSISIFVRGFGFNSTLLWPKFWFHTPLLWFSVLLPSLSFPRQPHQKFQIPKMEESLPILSCMQGSYKGIPYSQNSLKKAQYLQMSNEKIPWLFRAYRGWKPYPVIIGTIISHDIRIPIKNQPGWLMESIRFSVFFLWLKWGNHIQALRPCALAPGLCPQHRQDLSPSGTGLLADDQLTQGEICCWLFLGVMKTYPVLYI